MTNVACGLSTADTHTHPFNGPLSRTTRVNQYQKGKTNLDFTEARDSEWKWHQLGHMQVCTSLQTDNHASTPPLSFLQDGCPSCHPTNSVKALNRCLPQSYNNNNNTYDNIYGAVIMSQSKSSSCSLDECRLSTRWLPTLRQSQTTWVVSPLVGCYHPHPLSPLLLLFSPKVDIILSHGWWKAEST